MRHAVIIPTYNAEQFVCRALESVRCQTLLPHQIVVVDDGSRDSTVSVVQAWSRETGVDVKLIQQVNAGPGAARNFGLKAVDAQWVSFLDADDAWAPAKLESVSQAVVDKPDVDMVHTDRLYRLPDGTQTVSGFDPQQMIDRAYLCSHFALKTSTVSVSCQFLEQQNLAFGDMRTSEDYFLFWRAVLLSRAVGYVSEPLTLVDERGGSLTRNDNESALLLDNIDVISGILTDFGARQSNASECLQALRQFRYRLIQKVLLARSKRDRQFYIEVKRIARSAGAPTVAKAILSVAYDGSGSKTKKDWQ